MENADWFHSLWFHSLMIFAIYMFFQMLGCQQDPSEMEQANLLRIQGNEPAAMDIYEQIIRKSPGTGEAAEAQFQLQQIYLRYSERLEKVDEATSLKISRLIQNRWPDSSAAAQVQSRIDILEKEISGIQEGQVADQGRCAQVEADNSREAWHAYLTEYPEGVCSKRARERLKMKKPGLQERAEFRKILTKCEKEERECLRLESRFETLKVQKEENYLRTIFYEYLGNILLRHDAAQKEAKLYLEGLSNNHFDVFSLEQDLLKGCGGCVSGRANRDELRICRDAMIKGTETSRQIYMKAYPNGACNIPPVAGDANAQNTSP